MRDYSGRLCKQRRTALCEQRRTAALAIFRNRSGGADRLSTPGILHQHHRQGGREDPARLALQSGGAGSDACARPRLGMSGNVAAAGYLAARLKL